jgi:hypothetical protein
MVMSPSHAGIEPIEMSSNDGNRYCQRQYTGHSARCPNDAAEPPDRYGVTVTDRRHGYDRPPEGVRDASDAGFWNVLFGVVQCTGVDENTYGQRQHEHPQTGKAGLERLDQNLKF